MFRTCFRRPLSQSLSKIISSPPHSLPSKPDLFVCISCRARALATGTRRSRGTRAAGFLGAIKRLEAYVQLVERNFVDRVKKKAATEELPDIEITEEMQDEAYAALVASPTATAAFLPKPTPMSELLPSAIVSRLDSSPSLVAAEKPPWDRVLQLLEANGGLGGMSVSDANGLILCMDIQSRAENSSKVCELMLKASLEPDTFTYDLLMLAHAELAQPLRVRELFRDLEKKGISPTVYTYAHLLKAYACDADVTSAAEAFKKMHQSGITPNTVVYTTLIQTCLNGRELPTAWQIFNLMKLQSASTAPDLKTYTLMFRACALELECEKALDLYVDMTARRGIKLSQQAYHALIHALVMRADYCQQAWRIAREMQQEGFVMDRSILNTLIQGCGKAGDLTRARMLVRHMMASEKDEVAPDIFTFQNLFRTYASHRPKRKLSTSKTTNPSLNPVEDPTLTAPVYVGPDHRVTKKLDSLQRDVIPFYETPVLATRLDVMTEAKLVLHWLCENRPRFVDTQLMNAFLDVLTNHGGFYGLQREYFRAFSDPDPADFVQPSKRTAHKARTRPGSKEKARAKAWAHVGDDNPQLKDKDLDQGIRHTRAVPRNLWTFHAALEAAVKNSDLGFGRTIWRDRMEFSCTRHYFDIDPTLRGRLDFAAHRFMVTLLAKCNLLGEAVDWLRTVNKQFKWRQVDVMVLQIKALQVGDVQTIKDLKSLVKMGGDKGVGQPGEQEEVEETEDLSRTH